LPDSPNIGQTISHYRITGQLGSGGMGIVYEAEDLDLGRRVALKFLPPQLSSDQTALDRFLLEARTASALNHPNICTIYAVEKFQGETGGAQSFIAMELLEGDRLDHRLVPNGLPLDRLLDWSIQLADALDAAHAKGVIHRDIKPSNIFVTQRGQAKVLDFGLAKLSHPELQMETIGATQDAPAPERLHLTTPGAAVGTIAYMSPEQARGETLDSRTDLFSLGIVIYQMATGRLPFAGTTSAVTFHAILELDPPPALQLNASLPAKLDEIIAKALEKDRDLRYQSAADLRGDLKRVKRDTESGRKSAQMSGSSTAAARTTSSSALPPPGQSASSASAVTSSSGSKNTLLLIAAIVALAVIAIVGGTYALLSRRRAVPFQDISATKVTDTGNEVFAAISPNGQYVLCMSRKNGLSSLWLRNIPTNSNVQVQPAADVYYNGLTFSPDGNYFYFVRSDPGNPELKFLYRAPLLGGTPEKLASDVDSNVTFSPDGTKFAFMRYDNPEPGKYRLIVRPVQGSDADERTLASGPRSQSLYAPAWSPDGKAILCDELGAASSVAGLTTINVADGTRKTFYGSNTEIFENPLWMPDGKGLLGILREQSANFGQYRIAFISYPDAKITPVTHDTNNYSYVSVSGSGKIMAAVLSESRWNIFAMPGSGTSAQGRNLTASLADTNFTWMHDGSLISDQYGILNRIDSGTGTRTTFLAEEGKPSGNPYACADGQHLLFDQYGGANQSNIWRMDVSGGNLLQITQERHISHGVCSPDSKWVYYIAETNEATLSRVPIDGGASQTMSNLPIDESQFDISADGKLAAFGTVEHTGEHKERLAIVDLATGKAKLLDFDHIRFGLVRFSPDSKAVVYPARENGVDNLWLQPLDGSKGRQLTDFTSERIYDFHWSFDGKQLALVRGHTDSDVVLIRDQSH
jgi:eukaryotic-like serine/threonine-protein kinase